MNTRTNIFLIIVTASGGLLGCRKPYTPKVTSSTNSYLVVEGVINTGGGQTTIRLSHTVQLSSTVSSQPVAGASVTIVSHDGSNYPLTATGKGYYTSSGLNLSPLNKYSLKIITTDGKAYQSDFVEAKNSPPIDSVYYRVESNGVQVYTDTHDPSNNTRYYRWDFVDTYEYRSAFASYDIVAKIPQDTILPRPLSNQIFTCYRSDTSTDIVLNSSVKLTKDIITENQVTFIPSSSEKIESRYSILVKQYALTVDAFNYFQQLKKNTQQLGGIFDAQPSELPGNIHCTTNISEPVLGYVTAGSPAESRIFIDNRDLPAWHATTPYAGCKIDTALYDRLPGGENEVAVEMYNGYQIPLYPIVTLTPLPVIIGYAGAYPDCVDCTLRGSSKQPDFWISE